jgi:hypothetical protein
VKREWNSGLTFKTGATALALCVLAGSVANAACADRREMAALRAAALRQQLMVAGLTCHRAAYFNRFISLYQDEFQRSDRALMAFFVREGSGEDGYNSFKTREANDFALKSADDPNYFCGAAETEFYDALNRNLSLSELTVFEAPRLNVGYSMCERSADASDTDFAPPVLPARHQDVAENEAAPPPASQAAPQDAAAESTQDASEDSADAMDSYRAPAAYAYTGNANAWYGNAPEQMRQYQGADGRWYLVPAYYR